MFSHTVKWLFPLHIWTEDERLCGALDVLYLAGKALILHHRKNMGVVFVFLSVNDSLSDEVPDAAPRWSHPWRSSTMLVYCTLSTNIISVFLKNALYIRTVQQHDQKSCTWGHTVLSFQPEYWIILFIFEVFSLVQVNQEIPQLRQILHSVYQSKT